ncbi:MAG: DUF488 domain-containing protein [Thermoflavifilum sp.]|nr:DUF488 domain-containing protein [Thermoflavifilum sp.]
MEISIKRVYDKPERADGYRVLVDRLWPRGMKKETLHIDEWLKEIAPSTDLRKWFGHDPAKWKAFAQKYETELSAHEQTLKDLLTRAAKHTKLTLVYSAKDTQHNQAVVLQHYLSKLAAQT